jgi:hypothetical protein
LAAPPTALWVALALVVSLIEAVVFWIAWLLGDWNEALRLHEIRDSGVVMFAWFYGVLRVILHHPLFNAEYRDFLAMSPWQRSKPLPLGPVRLAYQDLVVVVLLAVVMSVQNRLPLALPLVGFLVGYLMALGATLWRTGPWWSAWAIGFGLGLTLRLAWWNGWAAAATIGATTAVAQYGLWQSWLQFPWTIALQPVRRSILDYDTDSVAIRMRREREKPFDAHAIWPFAGLRFSLPERSVDRWKAWMPAVLLGWWIYAIAGPLPYDPRDVHQFASFAFTFCSGLIALGRFVIYAAARHPPISFLGRIATGCYLIPAYDVVLVTPLLVAMMGLPIYIALYLVGVPAVSSLAIATTLVIGVACTGGPRLRAWQLTSPCRIVATTISGKEFEQI